MDGANSIVCVYKCVECEIMAMECQTNKWDGLYTDMKLSQFVFSSCQVGEAKDMDYYYILQPRFQLKSLHMKIKLQQQKQQKIV